MIETGRGEERRKEEEEINEMFLLSSPLSKGTIYCFSLLALSLSLRIPVSRREFFSDVKAQDFRLKSLSFQVINGLNFEQ